MDSRTARSIRGQRRPALMSEETFGPQGKRIEKPSYEEDSERFIRAFGFEREPKYEPEEIPPESWDPERKSMWAEYFKRHPEARPKPREIKKLGQVAPGVDGSEYLAKLLNEIKTLLENYAIFEEKLAAFEAKVKDECTSQPHHRWVDGQCLELDVTDDGTNPENAAAKSVESATVDRIMDKVVRKGKLFTKEIALNDGWTIPSGRGT